MSTIIGEKALHSILEYTYKHGKSYWYKIYDNEKDFKSDIEIDFGTTSSLQRHCKLRRDQYIALLIQCGLLTARGGTHRVEKKKFETLLTSLDIEGEFKTYDPRGGVGQRLYVRLGQKNYGYHKNVIEQVAAKASKPPRIDRLLPLQTDLIRKLNGIIDDNSSSDGEISESEDESDNDNTDKQMRKTDTSVDNDKLSLDITITDQREQTIDLSRMTRAQLEYSMGVLISEHQKRTREEEEERITQAVAVTPGPNDGTTSNNTRPSKKPRFNPPFKFAKGDETYTAVPMVIHKNNDAFARYQYKMPYVKCLIEELGKTKGEEGINESQGAKRLLKYLATNHKEEYVRVAKRRRLNVNGVIDDVGLAAMQSDARLKNWQLLKVIKHSQANLDTQYAVPFNQTKRFSEGYIKPQTKKFTHQYEDGKIETVTCEYQDICEIAEQHVGAIIQEDKVQPNDIADVDLAVGGDHGVGAFRVACRTIVTSKDDNMRYRQAIVATAVCKDTPETLKKTIMDWLTADLKRIHEQKLVVDMNDEGVGACTFMDEDDIGNDTDAHVFKVGLFNTGDLKWFATLLGMHGMSSQWCIYCYLRKAGWMAEDPAFEARTIENMKTYSDDPTLTGTDRMGVKTAPYWPFIPVDHYAIPLLHILIGVFNDIDIYFNSIVDYKIIAKSTEETAEWERYGTLDDLIEAENVKIKAWDATSEPGKRRAKLVRRTNLTAKQISEGTVPTEPLTDAEFVDYQGLERLRRNICKPREQLKKEKKDLEEKFDAYRLARKNDLNSVHNKLEEHAKECGLDRGKAFGGKYNGKDARNVMDKPEKFYNGMREILKQGKALTVTDQDIDTLCDDTIELMKAWNKFFSLLQKEKPTQAERESAQDVAKEAVRLHVKLLKNKTPKVHVAECHAVAQFLRFKPGFVRLITEHWVEHCHQIGSRDEQQFRNCANNEVKAHRIAAARHRDSNSIVQQRIKWVNDKFKRGKRAPYRSRARTETAQPPPQIPNGTQQTDNVPIQTPPTNNNDAESPQQAAQPVNIQPTPPNNDTNQSPQQPTPDQIEAPPDNVRRTGRRREKSVRLSDIGSL